MVEITWDSTHGAVDMSQVNKIEEALGVNLPKDYIECARINNGGYPSKEAFDFGTRTEVVFNRLLSFHESKNNYIVSVFNGLRELLTDEIYPFASDPFGNYLCFDYSSGGKSAVIVFWDHELAPEKAISKVCNTFTELLEKLYD
jgi:hypothetical protein